ncbi:ubiquitin carboxyl-terminal hydrolase 8-like isoform X2 [Tripterygium wilfordii]|uniref:ubiquitin carboxyl-terminal hydrolase 8-like isoform X2 n=1 Tax=Tripterygium wilfordii TaxID=458696 RepID=UPI0018F82EFB|nr:ubiquitin carboxyl-terminal hydrolase 8-like isoform X2 [Tripterygium wilfordii]
MGAVAEDLSDSAQHPTLDASATTNNDQRVYFVPYRWWKDAQESSDCDGSKGVLYTATRGSSYGGPMKIINNIFNSDLLFNLRREEDSVQSGENGEVGVSGRDFALVHGEMWLQALKWHSDAKAATKGGKCFSVGEDDMADIYPLQLRLSVFHETNSLGVKISKKDNAVEFFKRACKIFSIESDLLRIWDFSQQTTLFFLNDKNKIPKDCQWQSAQEICLELQVYGLSDSMKCREGKKDDMTPQSVGTNFSVSGRFGEAGSLGLTGLLNLGNTCFMNSAIQCLAHTPKLVDYFLGDYAREINHENPLGMNGEIALAFGDLLRKLWAPGATQVAPRTFKSKLARFAPQFSGFNQHDSQEVLSFLLDGLHEDLNRVKHKPYVEAKDGDSRPDEEVADDYWRYHLARNDSIIVDVCQGQYKSTLVCPVCKKVSVTFDPFMYLSLPLPSTTARTMTLTLMSTDGNAKPSQYTINVPKNGKCEDLIRALSLACSLRVDETLLVAEVYNNRIIRYLEEPADSLSLIRDGDRLVAYRLAKGLDEVPSVIFMHQQMEEQYIHDKLTSSWKAFGIPLMGKFNDIVNGSDICNLYLKLLTPFQIPAENVTNNDNSSERNSIEEVAGMEESLSSNLDGNSSCSNTECTGSTSDGQLQFYLTDEKGTVKESKIVMNEPVKMSGVPRRLYVLIFWPIKHSAQYDTGLLSSLPEIFKSDISAKRPQESISLYKCLEAFLKEEPLGPEDMWYCPCCEKHQQASKKLDLWRLPEILVIHLKRFSYSRFMKNKLEAYVDFPVDDFDLSSYILYKNCQLSHHYMLYAISNHYGSMGGGHYTAFVHHGGDRWYDFDDSHVHPISQDKIKTSAAYVLFYRRVVDV